MSANAALAAIVIEETLAWGIRDFVVCTGARNAPLVLPLLKAPEPIRIWRHFEERAAAFFALGLAKRDRRPVAVVTTSGTAVAELMPAVIEAHYSGIPLVLITADRPKRFRATGAPQAIEQAHLFGAYSEGCFDVEAAEDFPVGFPWNRARPIQINPCFEEPKAGEVPEINWEDALARGDAPFEAPIQPSSFPDPTLLSRFVSDFEGGVVLLGEIEAEDRDAVAGFLEKLGAPIWAEATSGLRERDSLNSLLLPGGDAVFRQWQPTKVLRIGGVPSLRFWRDLEEKASIPVMSVTRTGFPGLARGCETTGWVDFAEIEVQPCGAEMPSVEDSDDEWDAYPGREPSLMRDLSELISSDAVIFLGNSLPIRAWNLAASRTKAHPNVFANRGANGIDGEISTFLGLSEGAEEAWGFFGDLTTLYDATGPWVLDQLSKGKRRIVVINNGGGRIFSKLPALADLAEEEKRVTENRHQQDFSSWAAMWKLEYRRDYATDVLDDEGLGECGVMEYMGGL
ncbi:MAG: 2-succinyl-5-enolpyruvyl-6-hydroxy-3-cyclohexene-1-carboxylic-acid synthase [Verrucomicrobiae bacterium]|nr:2-succinyl-5-enolpyruvyl-6-hydroxy-3-cyclohexene-1-carboxylic-acid synthase [Verrucomicrobiae bacterium]